MQLFQTAKMTFHSTCPQVASSFHSKFIFYKNKAVNSGHCFVPLRFTDRGLFSILGSLEEIRTQGLQASFYCNSRNP